MATKKYTDWRSWFDGLVDASVPAGATAVITILTTNGLDNLGLHGVGESWKTALAQIGVQMAVGAANYVKNKPRPDVIVETTETSFVQKSSDGTQTSQGSKITTTTPVEPAQPKKE